MSGDTGATAKRLVAEAIERARQTAPPRVSAPAPLQPRPATTQAPTAAEPGPNRFPIGPMPVADGLEDPRPRLAMGVSTWNRRAYLERFVETFDATRSRDFRWYLIIADDGSTDDTLAYARSLELEDCTVVLIENKAKTIAGQTNSIIASSLAVSAELGFKADDDIYFLESGWDHLYRDAVSSSGFAHLVYHNDEWKPSSERERSGSLLGRVGARDALGCLYTFTPSLIEDVGYLDTVEFGLRGHAHLDFTVRACRVGGNVEDLLWDAADAEQMIGMWQRDEYIHLVDWSSDEVKAILTPEEIDRRLLLIDDEHRRFVPPRDRVPGAPVPFGKLTPHDAALADRLDELGIAITDRVLEVDRTYVLNLADDRTKWETTAASLSRHGVSFERFPAVDGGAADIVDAWRRYDAEGLVLPLEQQIGRRLIQSTGAMGYLRTMEAVLERAMADRLQSIVVFDDDVMLRTDFGDAAARTIAKLPDGASILYLGYSRLDGASAGEADGPFFTPDDQINGSFAMVLRSDAFEPLLEEIRRWEAPFDAGPLRTIAADVAGSTLATTDVLAIADVSSSTIRKPRDMASFASTSGWHLDAFEERSESHPRVSIYVPVTDQESEVGALLDSLRYQTHGALDIHVIDIASTDRTSATVARYAERDSRVIHWATPHPAPAHLVVNTLLRLEGNPWVMAVDASSRFSRGLVESLVAHIGDDVWFVRGNARSRGESSTMAGPSWATSLFNTEVGVRLGGLSSTTSAGMHELERRATSLAANRHSNRGRTVDVTDAVEFLSMVGPDDDALTSESLRFVREIDRGKRSARLPAPPPITLELR